MESPELAGLGIEDLVRLPREDDLDEGYGEPCRAFRAIPSEVETIVANLAIANMDFSEFADYADEDGVFRGF